MGQSAVFGYEKDGEYAVSNGLADHPNPEVGEPKVSGCAHSSIDQKKPARLPLDSTVRTGFEIG